VHKRLCGATKAVVDGGALSERSAVVRLLRRIRLYSAPFVAANEAAVGPGVLLVQSPNVLADFALLEAAVHPRTKARFARSVVLNYLTAADFKETVCRDDFELVPIALALDDALQALDQNAHFVALLKFRCGRMELVRCPWVPAKSVCKALAVDYLGKDCIQLNLEDSG
jgi:hypothetical protein